MSVRITLVDDSDLASAGLVTLLAPYGDRVVVVDNRDALAAPEDLDVVLYEPLGQSSMARSLLRDLQEAGDVRAAVFSWAAPEQLPASSANPHLAKSLTATQLIVSLERLVEGRLESPPVQPVDQSPPPDPATLRAADALDDGVPVAEVGLTPREVQIVGLIVSGLSNREIGEALELSVNSVKTYIRSAYRKMGVERRTQAVLWGLAKGLDVDPPALVG